MGAPLLYRFFQSCTDEEMSELCRRGVVLQRPANSVLIRESTDGDAFFLLLHGTAVSFLACGCTSHAAPLIYMLRGRVCAPVLRCHRDALAFLWASTGCATPLLSLAARFRPPALCPCVCSFAIRQTVSVKGSTIATCGPGQFFGEASLLKNVPCTATVSASAAGMACACLCVRVRLRT
jgi:CRP-like cAMP-binding protein